MTEPEPEAPLFATFPRRLMALVVDGLVWVGVFLAAGLFGALASPGPQVRAGLLIGCLLFFLLYEPVLVAWTGRTIGHRAANLKVVADTASTQLPFWKAMLRWLLKLVSGVAAFVTMPATRRSQALHDLPFGTTVQIHDASKATPVQYVAERPTLSGGPLPSRLRRVLVIASYAVVLFIMMVALTLLTLSPDCLDSNRCSTGEDVVSRVLGTGWLAGTVLIAVLAWQGRIWGCRRGSLPQPTEPAIEVGAV